MSAPLRRVEDSPLNVSCNAQSSDSPTLTAPPPDDELIEIIEALGAIESACRRLRRALIRRYRRTTLSPAGARPEHGEEGRP